MIIVISDSGTVAAPVGTGGYEYRDVQPLTPGPRWCLVAAGATTPCQIGIARLSQDSSLRLRRGPGRDLTPQRFIHCCCRRRRRRRRRWRLQPPPTAATATSAPPPPHPNTRRPWSARLRSG